MVNTNQGKIIVIVLSFLFSVFVNANDNSIGKISFIIGAQNEIKMKNAEEPGWKSARLYAKVKNNDQIQTQTESRCEVKLNDGSTIRIGEKSKFTFTEASDSPQKRSFSSLLSWGRIWANVRKVNRSYNQFQITAPAAVCAVRGTIYRMESDSTTRIMVYDGEVDVGPAATSQDSTPVPSPPKNLQPQEIQGPYEIPGPYEVTLDHWIRIVKGFQIEIRPDGKYAKSEIDEETDQNSEWVRWNQQRDAVRRD
ncbi:FecR domain-containing protein [candidate division KSB1 bacterium]|nr:FecR domain-containing protein [candidate division KSB1 bacterium]